jgi:hypothetical protein
MGAPVARGQADSTAALLRAGADPNVAHPLSGPPLLHAAVRCGQGGAAWKTNGNPCFGFVLQAWGELALLRLLLAHGAQVSSVKRGTRSIWCRKIVTAPYRTH